MYSFRMRFLVAPSSELPELLLQLGSGADQVSVHLRSDMASAPKEVVAEAHGFCSEEEATSSAKRFRACFLGALAGSRVGVDFGNQRPTSSLTAAGIQYFFGHLGHERIINDHYGVLVYETNPTPQFVRTSSPTGVLGTPPDKFTTDLAFLWNAGCEIPDRVQDAYDSYAEAFFATNEQVRLVALVTAIEYLIDPKDRSAALVAFVDRVVEESMDLPGGSDELQSFRSGLQQLKSESIGQAGKRLVRELLHDDPAVEEKVRLFRDAYSLRSKLVHGYQPRPDRSAAGAIAAPVEVLAANLIAAACRRPPVAGG